MHEQHRHGQRGHWREGSHHVLTQTPTHPCPAPISSRTTLEGCSWCTIARACCPWWALHHGSVPLLLLLLLLLLWLPEKGTASTTCQWCGGLGWAGYQGGWLRAQACSPMPLRIPAGLGARHPAPCRHPVPAAAIPLPPLSPLPPLARPTRAPTPPPLASLSCWQAECGLSGPENHTAASYLLPQASMGPRATTTRARSVGPKSTQLPPPPCPQPPQANMGPNTNTAHFSIMMGPAHHLDGHYTIFGAAVRLCHWIRAAWALGWGAGWERGSGRSAPPVGQPLAAPRCSHVPAAAGPLRPAPWRPGALQARPPMPPLLCALCCAVQAKWCRASML